MADPEAQALTGMLYQLMPQAIIPDAGSKYTHGKQTGMDHMLPGLACNGARGLTGCATLGSASP